MKGRKVYKLVMTESIHKSICVPEDRGGVVYIVGKLIKPKIRGSKLYAYKSLKYAKEARNIFPGTAIMECESDSVIIPTKWVPLTFDFSNLKEFWKHPKYDKIRENEIHHGVALCDSVKPLGIIA